jgi:type I restriction enzyme S subunit
MDYKRVKLGEVADITRGISYKGADYSTVDNTSAEAFINLKCISADGFRWDGIKYYSGKHKPNQSTGKGDLLIANTDLTRNREVIGNSILVPKLDRDQMCFSHHLTKIEIHDENILNKKYLYYYLKAPKVRSYMIGNSDGTTVVMLPAKAISKLEIEMPNLKIQEKIVHILSALDQKIELNNQQNETLFELGRQLYIEKFENNQTIGKVELGNFFPVITGKKDANASSENGKYPFFTCSKTISKIDDYVFDTSAILLAGNGDFNVKFYRGRFDAYQRTYVLIPNNPEYLGFLYWAISYNLPRITANYRGSVIKFITKGNIENFKIPFVDNKYIPTFMKYLEKIEKNNQQNKVLAGLRDALLPKLMSDEINLNEVTINE